MPKRENWSVSSPEEMVHRVMGYEYHDVWQNDVTDDFVAVRERNDTGNYSVILEEVLKGQHYDDEVLETSFDRKGDAVDFARDWIDQNELAQQEVYDDTWKVTNDERGSKVWVNTEQPVSVGITTSSESSGVASYYPKVYVGIGKRNQFNAVYTDSYISKKVAKKLMDANKSVNNVNNLQVPREIIGMGDIRRYEFTHESYIPDNWESQSQEFV